MKKILLILTMLLMLPVASAFDIAIKNVNIIPQIAEPGQKVDIRITVENQGNADLEDISVNLDLVSFDSPFSPVNSASQKIIDELGEGEKEVVTFTLSTLSTAESKIYKIPLEISYDDEESITIIGLQVGSTPKIDVNILNSEVLTPNTKGKVTLKFVNRGLTNIKFLNIKLQDSENYEILSPKTVYIGDLDSDDYETAEFELYWKSTSNKLPILVEFKDSTNKQYSEQLDLGLRLYSKEEIKQLGLGQSKSFIIPTVIIIAILLFLFWRRKRRRAIRNYD